MKEALALIVDGVVRVIEEATYDYGDIMDENYNSLLTRRLLEYAGKRVRVTVELVEEPES